MGIFQRISDIISANMNELTDQYEDPETMLKQAIREMEDSIAEVTQQTAKAMAHARTLSRELERNCAGSQEWRQRAVKAVEAGDDALARKALARKNEHDKLVAALEDQSGVAREASTTMRHQLAGMQAKLSEAKRNLATLAIRKRSADLRKKMDAQAAGLVSSVDDAAFAKFDRLKAKVEQAEAEADAVAELRAVRVGGGSHDPREPAAEDLDLAAQLADLKAKYRQIET